MKRSLVCLATTLVAAHAGASIITVSPSVAHLTAPPPGPTGALPPPFAMAWDEQQGVSVSGLAMDRGPGPWVAPPAAPTTHSGIIDSHMIHWTTDHSGVAASGWVQFSAPILGVIYNGNRLAMSDPIVGLPPAVYMPGHPGRFLDIGSRLWIPATDPDTLHFDFLSGTPGHEFTEVRVITAVPTPGSLALLGAGGLVAARRRPRS